MEHERDQTGNKPETNRDDYLWDSSGVPDAEIQRLEGLLGKFRHGERHLPDDQSSSNASAGPGLIDVHTCGLQTGAQIAADCQERW